NAPTGPAMTTTFGLRAAAATAVGAVGLPGRMTVATANSAAARYASGRGDGTADHRAIGRRTSTPLFRDGADWAVSIRAAGSLARGRRRDALHEARTRSD